MGVVDHVPEADPHTPTIEAAVARVAEEVTTQNLSPLDKLAALAKATGNLAATMSQTDLVKIGNECVDDYENDDKDRKDWKKTAEEALEAAAQEFDGKTKTYPWPNASNIRYPILSTAMLQFNARAYPAIVKGDEPVLCKVVGKDNGRPKMGPDGKPVMLIPGPDGEPMPIPPGAPPPPPETGIVPQPAWQIPPGAKGKRAQRVADYMNTTIMYRMDDWEGDTDSLLQQLPVVGCVFRKVYYCTPEMKQKACMVSALRIVVPKGARNLETTPRLTEEVPDVYPSQINEDMRSGKYIEVDLFPKPANGETPREDLNKPRLLLEQHRLMDLDDDGCPEPYIVTLDHETRKVLRIEANFGPQDVRVGQDGKVISITKGQFYVKYSFFPHPAGHFYDLGFGHLLEQMGGVIDTALNQLMDAGTAQTAGGGFIASGVRLQSRGQGSVIKYRPGDYVTVDVPGNVLREAIVERTLPNVSPVTYQVLEMILGAAKDISGIKDVMTGDASNTGQVGTTLALIEQGLQVFNAIYKRIFRAAKNEYQLLFDNIGKYGGETAAQDYIETLDDPEADFESDFSSKDLDIRPVSDPASVTHIQRITRSQFLKSMLPEIVQTGGDGREVMMRVLEAAEIEDVDKIYPPISPEAQKQAEEQRAMAKAAFQMEMQGKQAGAAKDAATAGKAEAETEGQKIENSVAAFQAGHALGAAA